MWSVNGGAEPSLKPTQKGNKAFTSYCATLTYISDIPNLLLQNSLPQQKIYLEQKFRKIMLLIENNDERMVTQQQWH